MQYLYVFLFYMLSYTDIKHSLGVAVMMMNPRVLAEVTKADIETQLLYCPLTKRQCYLL